MEIAFYHVVEGSLWAPTVTLIDYLKNEKSFRSEIKNILPCFTSALF